jgi:transcriptional regulator with XRE-family HTH domain
MKKLSAEAQRRLQRKKISIVDYIFRLQRARGYNQTRLADLMGVKTSYLNRILRKPEANLTLETIVKCEDALQADIIVVPAEYEERLIDSHDRLFLIIQTAQKVYGKSFTENLRGHILKGEETQYSKSPETAGHTQFTNEIALQTTPNTHVISKIINDYNDKAEIHSEAETVAGSAYSHGLGA